MKRAGWSSILVAVVMLTVAVIAEAQQPTKIPRIGYLMGATRKVNRPAPPLSARACANLGTWRGKTLSLSGDLQRENSIASPRSRQN